MQYGINLLCQIPLRESITHSSEMISQLLFGEIFIIEEKYQHWLKIQTEEEAYEGWVDEKQITYISEAIYKEIKSENSKKLIGDFICPIINLNSKETHHIGLGSQLPLFNESTITIGNESFRILTDQIIDVSTPQANNIIPVAQKYLNVPYLWGGKSVFGIDCSGFTSMVFKICGQILPRDAKQQAQVGSIVNFIEEARPGDLMFFDNEEGNITHVGIYLGDHKIIHASGKVKKDHVDHQGILSSDLKCYTHNLRVIKRIIN